MTQLQDAEQQFGSASEFDPRVLLQIAKRRWWVFALPAIVVFGAVAWIARVLPPVYTATATILVAAQQIPTNLAQSTVTGNSDERIQIIQQRLMTRDNLLAIARKYSLYAAANASPTETVDLLRKATTIKRIDVGGSARQGVDALGFTVSFENDDANAAAKVTNEFVTSILEQNIQARNARANETSKFFDQHVSQLEKDLAAQEARIVDFKNKNQASLPETLQSRETLLAQIQNQAGDLRGRIATLQSQKRLLESQDGPALGLGDNSAEAELARLRSQLVQLRAVFSDNHPEVRAVTARIAALEKASTPKAPDAAPPKDPRPNPTSGPNAARIADIDAQVTALNRQLGDLEARSQQLDQSIQRTSEVQIALSVLMRDYETLQTQYRSAQTKAADAEIGQQLEQDRQAERFEVLEQAVVPPRPTRPDRQRIMLIGAFGAVATGGGLVALVELLDKSIRGAGDLERLLKLRPIGSIPYIATAEERRRRKRNLVIVALAAVFVIVAGLIAVSFYYLPLNVIVQRVFERIKF